MDNNKIQLSALGALAANEERYIQIGEATVGIKRFIPHKEVLDMIQWCIDFIINDRPFLSAPLKSIVKDFAILKFYTTIDVSFLEEYTELGMIYAQYDYVKYFNVMDKVMQLIDANQLKFFNNTLDETLESIIGYRNSAAGMVDVILANAERDGRDLREATETLDNDQKMNKIYDFLSLVANAGQDATQFQNTPGEDKSSEK